MDISFGGATISSLQMLYCRVVSLELVDTMAWGRMASENKNK